MDTRTKYLLDISNAAFGRFYPFRQLAQDICENVYPIRADYTGGIDWSELAGNLYDSYPVQARQTHGDMIDAMLRQGEWFMAGSGDIERDERPNNALALKRVTQKVHGALKYRYSNWSNASKEADMDWASVGQCAISVEESAERTHLVYKAHHPKDCAWVLGDDGRVVMFFRNARMSARDIMRRIDSGRWNGEVDAKIHDCMKTDPGKEFEIRHCLIPVDDMYADDRAKRKTLRHPFLSVYLDTAHEKTLHEGGVPVFNYLAPRNRVFGNRPFGISPHSLNSLPDARMLQDVALVILEQGQKAVDPPILGAGSLFPRDLNFFAGGFTEIDLPENAKIGDMFTTIDTGQRINVGLEIKQDTRNLIAESWALNKLTLPSARDMREVEVMVRTEEFRRAALPIFMPIQENYHEPLLGLTFDMLVNMGEIRAEDLPNDLQGEGVNFNFNSPLNEAEDQKIVQEYLASVQVIQTGSALDQKVAAIFDTVEATERALLAAGRPEWIRDEREKKQALDDMAGAEQMAGMADAANVGADTVKNLAEAQKTAMEAGMASI